MKLPFPRVSIAVSPANACSNRPLRLSPSLFVLLKITPSVEWKISPSTKVSPFPPKMPALLVNKI